MASPAPNPQLKSNENNPQEQKEEVTNPRTELTGVTDDFADADMIHVEDENDSPKPARGNKDNAAAMQKDIVPPV